MKWEVKYTYKNLGERFQESLEKKEKTKTKRGKNKGKGKIISFSV